MTPERITISLAGKPVEIEIRDAAVVDDFRSRVDGFVVPAVPEPWIRVEAHLWKGDSEPGRPMSFTQAAPDRFVFEAGHIRGSLEAAGTVPSATVEVRDGAGLSQALFIFLSVLLPREGGLLLHGNTVTVDGKAVAFIGHSGAGKSTAVRALTATGHAEHVSDDRTVVVGLTNGRGPRVALLPRLQRDHAVAAGPGEVPLTALLVPGRGPDARVEELGKAQALARVLAATLVPPPGEGVEAELTMESARRLVDRVRVAEVAYTPGADLLGALRAGGIV